MAANVNNLYQITSIFKWNHKNSSNLMKCCLDMLTTYMKLVYFSVSTHKPSNQFEQKKLSIWHHKTQWIDWLTWRYLMRWRNSPLNFDNLDWIHLDFFLSSDPICIWYYFNMATLRGVCHSHYLSLSPRSRVWEPPREENAVRGVCECHVCLSKYTYKMMRHACMRGVGGE